jgi:hypothetical protein
MRESAITLELQKDFRLIRVDRLVRFDYAVCLSNTTSEQHVVGLLLLSLSLSLSLAPSRSPTVGHVVPLVLSVPTLLAFSLLSEITAKRLFADLIDFEFELKSFFAFHSLFSVNLQTPFALVGHKLLLRASRNRNRSFLVFVNECRSSFTV